MKTWIKQNKYIRLRIEEIGAYYRADISINKYAYDENRNRYYEINFDIFHPLDYSSEKEAFINAKEWLYEELNLFQKNIKLESGKNE